VSARHLMPLKVMIRPFWQRIRLGEGGLVGMATWAAAWGSRSPVTTTYVFVLTTLLLVSLYLYNDVSDRQIDAHNPKKIAQHREPLLQHPRLFLFLAIALHVAVCLIAWQLLGPMAGACAASLLLLGPIYSAMAKQVPGIDVVVVGVMGGAVVGLATSSLSLLLMSAAMTGVSHAFQTQVDAKADLASGIRSSGTAPAALRTLIWLGLVGAFAGTAMLRLGPLWAVSGVIPYLLLTRAEDPNRAWGCARVYFATVWIAATV